jgi:hypothetical protein
MRIIANENVAATVIAELRRRGHDVNWVKESNPGTSDESVLATAQSEQRLVLTYDKDFGELAFRYGLPATCGVLLGRGPRFAVSRRWIGSIAASGVGVGVGVGVSGRQAGRLLLTCSYTHSNLK